jgi:hypothetical protein
MAVAACDAGPPTATLFEPNARWLHDVVSVHVDSTFDRWGYGGSVIFAGDERVGSGSSWRPGDGETTFTATVRDAVEVSGAFRLELYGSDTDGQPIQPDTFEWELATWTLDELPVDAPPTGAPQVIERLAPSAASWLDEERHVVVVWPTESGLRAMSRDGNGAWNDLGAPRDDFGEPVTVSGPVRVCADAYGQVFAAWGTSFAVYAGDAFGHGRWDVNIDRPWVGEEPSFSLSPFSTVALAGVQDGSIAIARGVPTEEGREWTTASLPVTSVVGRPAIALVGYEDTPFVAYVDATAEGTTLRVAAWYEGEWTTLGEVDVVSPIGDPAIATNGDSTVVTWNDGGTVAAAKVGFAGWRLLPSPGTADSAPDLAGARTGSVAVSLIDGDVASTLRWDGESWIPLGDPWLEGGGTPSTSSTAVWAGRVPVTAWLDEGAVRVALYNGEVPVSGE